MRGWLSVPPPEMKWDEVNIKWGDIPSPPPHLKWGGGGGVIPFQIEMECDSVPNWNEECDSANIFLKQIIIKLMKCDR